MDPHELNLHPVTLCSSTMKRKIHIKPFFLLKTVTSSNTKQTFLEILKTGKTELETCLMILLYKIFNLF